MRAAAAILTFVGCVAVSRRDTHTIDLPYDTARYVADEAVQRRIRSLDNDLPHFPRSECERTREGYRATVGACADGVRAVIQVSTDCSETSRGRKWYLPDGGQIVRLDGDMAIYWYDRATLAFREEKWRACDGGPLPRNGPVEGRGGTVIYWGAIPYDPQ